MREGKWRVATQPTGVFRVGGAVVALSEGPANLLLEAWHLPLLNRIAAVSQLAGQSTDEATAVGLDHEGSQVMVLAILVHDRHGGAVKCAGAHVTHAGAREALA